MSMSAEVIVAIRERLNGMFSELIEKSCAIKLLHNNFMLIQSCFVLFFLIRNDNLHQWRHTSYWYLNTRVSEVNLFSHKGKILSFWLELLGMLVIKMSATQPSVLSSECLISAYMYFVESLNVQDKVFGGPEIFSGFC